MKTHPNDTSNEEILEAMLAFSASVDMRFEKIDQRFEGIDQRFENIDQRFEKMEKETVTKDYLTSELNKFKTTMVTKDYLDDKLANQYSDIIQFTRREIQSRLSGNDR